MSDINDKIDDLLSTKRERLTAEDIQNIYEDIPEYYQCSRNTFPPTWKDAEYELGAAGNRVVPYNKDCYKIILSSRGSSPGVEKDQAIIRDTTMKRQEKAEIIWKDGNISASPSKEGQDPWKSKDLTKVLKRIYMYSNKKYGEYGKSCKLDQNINVDRIRVTNLSCLKYDSSCIIGSCDSRTLDKTVTFEQIEQELKKREKKVLYRDPVPSLTQYPVENMEDWRIDTLSHFPYTKITPYDAYFENLEN